MTDPKTPQTVATALLQRQALSSTITSPAVAPTTTATIPTSILMSTGTSTNTAASILKAFGSGIVIPDLTSRSVRKQANPVKQAGLTPLATTSVTAESVTKSKPPTVVPPLPPPLIPAKPSTSTEHSYASKPAITNGGDEKGVAEGKKSAEVKSSSDSSSDESSSESSSSSGDESEKEETVKKPEGVPPETPGPSTGLSRRGRQRGRPRKETATPQPSKVAKLAIKERKSQTSPRKKTGRIPKVPALFNPDTANGKAKKRGRGCGACPGCLRDDCGTCNYCKDKTKFGGPGRKKQRCALRVCSNFVKALAGNTRLSSRVITPTSRTSVPTTAASTLPSSPAKMNVIPVSKSTSASKVAEILEHLRQNRTTVIPPVIDKDCIMAVFTPPHPKTTSIIVSKAQPLKTTPSGTASVTPSETKIFGPVAPPIVTSKAETPTDQPPSTTVSTPSTTASTQSATVSTPSTAASTPSTAASTPSTVASTPSTVASTPSTAASTPSTSVREKTSSDIALRTRRKQREREAEAEAKLGKMKCIVCGRERKQGMVRSDKFCSQRCSNQWSEKNSSPETPGKTGAESEPMEVDKIPVQQKKVARALKNLQIDMAFSATPKPTTTNTATPTATTAANKRPTASTGVQPTVGKKTTEQSAGAKRPSQQPPAQKKAKEEPPKSVSFSLNFPTSTVDPISAPPLNRTVPPPSISIVPLDQLTALFTQQQQKAKKQEVASKTLTKIPAGLPVDVRSWTIAQVVRFFESTSDCKDYASIFREQEVDGTALLLLTHESLVKCLGIKLGRALKIMVHVEELQKLYSQ